MLVQKPTGVETYGMDQDEFAMYGKCHQVQYLEALDSTTMNFKDTQHRTQINSRQAKKPRESIESFQNYVAIIQDPFTGQIMLRSSSTMKTWQKLILGGEATSRFRECIRVSQNGNAFDVKDDHGSKPAMVSAEAERPCNRDQPPNRPRKKRKGSREVDVPDSSELSGRDVISWKKDEDPEDDDDTQYVAYRADARDDWEKWFSDAFRAVQQVSCRVIAKEWIKTIHPKKQSTHPYNGKNPRTGERGDSNSTKPPYWPKDVIHKEPDHINKEARTKLLVHLLMHTPHREMSASGESRSAREITAENLQESLEQKKLERDMDQLRKKSPIIEQIIEVRKALEQFEEGGINGDTMITAFNYSDFNRGCKKEDDDETDESVEAEGADRDGVDKEFMDIRGDEPRAAPANTNSGSRLVQQDIPNDKDAKSRRCGRRMPRNDELRTAAGLTARRESRAQMSPIQYTDLNIHPPLVLPGWNSQQPSPAMPRSSYSTQHNVSPHAIHDPFSPSSWATPTPMHPGMDINGQFADQVMITPPPLPNVMPQASYMDMGLTHGSQQPFPGVSHQSHFNRGGYPPSMHDPGHGSMRATTPYEAFMGPPMPNQDMLQHRQYFM